MHILVKRDSNLIVHRVEAVLLVLRVYGRALGWSIADIIGIPPGIRTHKIKLEEHYIPGLVKACDTEIWRHFEET